MNPLPVAYDEGIKDFEIFTQVGDRDIYHGFLKALKPDIIHVHTLMGLHKNFLMAAKELGIRLVFTTHDFFPICPKVKMFRNGKICTTAETCEECGTCNNTALSIKKILLLQSPLYRIIKDSIIVRKARKHHRDKFLSDNSEHDQNGIVGSPEDFLKLRKYYQDMLSLMDIVHYNSTVSKSAFEKVCQISGSRIISITHSDISDHRRRKSFSNNLLRIRYLGPGGGAKGFFLLKDALDKLWEECHNFCLDIHFAPVETSPYMRIHGRYSYRELEGIFSETDILVAPSIWLETFGYTVLEALSYGVPVLISGTVGAKDILTEGAGIVIDDITSEKLLQAFKTLTPDRLDDMNKTICKEQSIMTIQQMSEMIMKECYTED